MTTSSKSPSVAFLLSLLFPGLGHLYLGERWGAFIYAVMGTGIWLIFLTSHSFISRLAVLFIFPFVFIPVCRDAVDIAKGKKKAVTGTESRIYVIWMLCCVGPFAIPLLWQNKKFSMPVKILWTVIVLSVVVIAFLILNAMGNSFDDIAKALH